MIENYLSSDNEMCYSTRIQPFSPTKHTLSVPTSDLFYFHALTMFRFNLISASPPPHSVPIKIICWYFPLLRCAYTVLSPLCSNGRRCARGTDGYRWSAPSHKSRANSCAHRRLGRTQGWWWGPVTQPIGVKESSLRRVQRADGETPTSFSLFFHVDSQPPLHHL